MQKSWIYHNSQEQFFRKPFGAVSCGQRISLSLEIRSLEPVGSVFTRTWKQYREELVPMKLAETGEKDRVYQAQITAPAETGLFWYYFVVMLASGRTYYYGNNCCHWGGEGQIYEHLPPSYQVTVYEPGTATPNWFKESVMYQIFVERFYNGHENGRIENPKPNSHLYTDWWQDIPVYRRDPVTGRITSFDFFGGNLLGVLKKLPYLKELGINVIYFNPLFEAVSNHKYDTGDYHKIDNMFGDNRLFEELCTKAQEMGIAIILDGVFSHTGSDSIYFNKEGHYPSLGAYQSKDSPYYSWYRFTEYPHRYESWWGIDSLPNVKEMDASYQDFIIYGENSVLKHWMKIGIKGWRLDVVDELPDEFLKNFYQALKEIDPDAILIGEVWEDASNKVSYNKFRGYLLGRELDSTMNYPFRQILLAFFLGCVDAEETHRALMSLSENYPLHHFYSAMNLIGSHDVVRVLTLLGDAPPEQCISKEEQGHYKLPPAQRKRAVARLKLLVLWQMTFPGVPCIYYGDEAGLEGYADPLNRRTYPWGREDRELLDWYKKIIALRNQYDVLKTGEWQLLYAQGDVYGYLRRIVGGQDVFGQPKEDNLACLFFNRSLERAQKLSLDVSSWCEESLTDLLVKKVIPLEEGILSFTLQPLEGKLLMQRVK